MCVDINMLAVALLITGNFLRQVRKDFTNGMGFQIVLERTLLDDRLIVSKIAKININDQWAIKAPAIQSAFLLIGKKIIRYGMIVCTAYIKLVYGLLQPFYHRSIIYD